MGDEETSVSGQAAEGFLSLSNGAHDKDKEEEDEENLLLSGLSTRSASHRSTADACAING